MKKRQNQGTRNKDAETHKYAHSVIQSKNMKTEAIIYIKGP